MNETGLFVVPLGCPLWSQKHNFMKRILILALSIAWLSGFSSFAEDSPKANPFTLTLAAVPPAELPAKTAALVKHAAQPTQTAATKDIVRAAVALNPAAAPAILAAIARAVPHVAPVAAGTAALMQPDLASAIARAAAVAAPGELSKIVIAVCKAVPSDYRNIASSVSRAVPGSNKEVLKAVAEAIPALKPSIDSSLAAAGGSLLSAAQVLGQKTVTGTSSGPISFGSSVNPVDCGSLMPRGISTGPPYLPPGPNIKYLNPADSGRQSPARNPISP